MLWGWWKKQKNNDQPMLDHVGVIMYTRQGCHLCEEAWKVLTKHQSDYGFRLQSMDVDNDAELKTAYGDSVPVVTVDGKVRFRGGVNPVLLERLLAAKACKPKTET